MDFDLSDDQRLLKDSVDRLIADRYAFDSRKKIMAEPGGWSRDMWAQFAELGLLGLPFPEAQGGFGGGPVETMLVMEAIGRGLVLEPFLPTVILGGGLIQAQDGHLFEGGARQAHQLLLAQGPGLAAGAVQAGVQPAAHLDLQAGQGRAGQGRADTAGSASQEMIL